MRFSINLFLVGLLLSAGALYGRVPVLVSITPQKFLVEEIGGEEVSVEVLVPRGADAHHYEPSPKQVERLRASALWFRIGENFEPRLLPLCTHMQVVDQRKGCDLILGSCCTAEGADPHIWLSPRLLKVEARAVADALAACDPDHASSYQRRGKEMEARLTALDQEVGEILAGGPKVVLVSHPAFSYLCRDYGILQLAIEREGHEPTPRYLSALIAQAREAGIRKVFLHSRTCGKGGSCVAKALGAELVYLDPYAEQLIESITTIARAFAS